MDLFDTDSHHSMIVLGYWEVIKRHDSCIYAQGVNMGVPSKGGL